MKDRLKWVPVPLEEFCWIPSGLTDSQVGWFVNLLAASLRSEWPGYLAIDRPEVLWRLAGAQHPETWRRHGSMVLARFQRAQLHGREVLYFPPLVATIQQQLRRISDKKPRFPKNPQESTEESAFSLYLDFDVGSKEKKEGAKKPVERSRDCPDHPESGLTQWGTCWGCYAERCSAVLTR